MMDKKRIESLANKYGLTFMYDHTQGLYTFYKGMQTINISIQESYSEEMKRLFPDVDVDSEILDLLEGQIKIDLERSKE